MTEDKGIFIKNIYYMLAYAFQVLRQTNYEDIASEDFEHTEDLFASILAKGIAQQLKQGLYREYIAKQDDLSVLRGKLDIQNTIKKSICRKQLLSCEFDELSENNIYNQIIKTTAVILLNSENVSKERKNALRKVMLFFDGIDKVAISSIRWDMLKFQRNNRTYEMLMNICYFVLDGLLQTTNEGSYRMASFSDKHMSRLYEKFILEYYRRHHKYLNPESREIKWALNLGHDETGIKFLPKMKSDVMLSNGDRTLIIDAKYYTHVMQEQYDVHTLHSGNLYQIFAYVKNYDPQQSGKVSGMLLYAKTDEEITPDCEFFIGNNKFIVKTLDLNKDFRHIATQLDNIVIGAFGINKTAEIPD